MSDPTTQTRVSPFRAGLATMLVGAVVLGVGMLQTTAATPQPRCPDGTKLLAKFEYSGSGKNAKYRFVEPRGNDRVVTISDANAKGGKWRSTQPVSVILVKGGPGHKAMDLNPPQDRGSFDNSGLKTGGKGKNTPDISNIQFCRPKHPVTTTTTSTTTSTTTTSTTTTTTSTTSTTTTTTVPNSTTTTTFRT